MTRAMLVLLAGPNEVLFDGVLLPPLWCCGWVSSGTSTSCGMLVSLIWRADSVGDDDVGYARAVAINDRTARGRTRPATSRKGVPAL